MYKALIERMKRSMGKATKHKAQSNKGESTMKDTKPTTCSHQSAISLEPPLKLDIADISTAAFIQGRIRGYRDNALHRRLKKNSKSEAAHRNRVRMIFFERFDFSALEGPSDVLFSSLLEVVSAIKEEGLWNSPFAFEEFLLCAGTLINRSTGLTDTSICDIDTALHTINAICESFMNSTCGTVCQLIDELNHAR